MDALKLLKLEFEGIKGTIHKYTGNSFITNCINQLEIAVETKDIEAIQYQLKNIDTWYGSNISEIAANEFVGMSECANHKRNWDIIKQLRSKFSEYEPSVAPLFEKEEPEKRVTESREGGPSIFISHKSDDKKYGDALRNFIIGLGVKENQLIYTSHPLHKVPLGRNIYDYLRENINGKVFMIILWSDKYLESPACMNEMGAAWVAKSDYTNIYTPDFSFDNQKYHECAVDTRKMGAVLKPDEHCKTSMIELKDKIQELFNLPNDEKKTAFLLDQFMKEIGD